MYDSDNILGEASGDWISYEDNLKADSTYYSSTDALSLTFEYDGSASETFYFKYYYSSDSMFSDRELQSPVYTGSASAVVENGTTYYHFDFTGNIQPGYYIITVSTSSGGESILISACQVVDQ